MKKLLTGVVRYMSDGFDFQPPRHVNYLDSGRFSCPMNSRARAIPNRNSWLKATTSKAALRRPSGPASPLADYIHILPKALRD